MASRDRHPPAQKNSQPYVRGKFKAQLSKALAKHLEFLAPKSSLTAEKIRGIVFVSFVNAYVGF